MIASQHLHNVFSDHISRDAIASGITSVQNLHRRFVDLINRSHETVEPAIGQERGLEDARIDAIEAIEQGIAANPDSAILHIYLAAIYIENDDYQQAELHVSKAEQIDPESELVAGYRQILKMQKPKHTYTTHKLNQPLKQKKKRR